MLFGIEPGLRTQAHAPHRLLHLTRTAAAAGVIVATLRYVFEENILDAINSVLWIGVVLLLEAQLRFPAFAQRARPLFAAIAGCLYGGLVALVAAWGWRGDWFDAYDAVLWLVAFGALELTVFRRRDASAAPKPSYTPAAKP